MPGVVSIPHGWGHDAEGIELSVAREHAGSNSNVLSRSDLIDPLSGNAVLNGIPVELAPLAAAKASGLASDVAGRVDGDNAQPVRSGVEAT